MQQTDKHWRLLQLLALAELLSAALLPGRYMFPYHRLQCLRDVQIQDWCLNPWEILGDIYSVAFICVPVAATVAVFLRHWFSLPLMVITPVLLFFSGVGAFPLIAKLAPFGEARTFVLLFINVSATLLAVFLFRNIRRQSASA